MSMEQLMKMRTFVIAIVCFAGLSLVLGQNSDKTILQCHQGNFNINKTGTEVTPCASSKAQSCQIVFLKSKQTVNQTCINTLCSPNSKVEPINVCRLTTTGITCCCHGYGCNKRQLITVLPPSYWAR
ncbi:hypothetical protein M3Y98_00117100 [Aphelenchoides besseyi]|nr:hypothetical protein M3Y98_00117100 [Aphelenchoides besseyi]